MFSKTTCHPDIKINYIYLHYFKDGQHQLLKERLLGWVLQVDLYLDVAPHQATLRHSVTSLYNLTKKKVDMEAIDFNGTPW